jgi:hypothetical protein
MRDLARAGDGRAAGNGVAATARAFPPAPHDLGRADPCGSLLC